MTYAVQPIDYTVSISKRLVKAVNTVINLFTAQDEASDRLNGR